MVRLFAPALAFLLAAPALAQPASPTFVGSWSGTLKQGESEMEVLLDVARDDTGGYAVYFGLPAEGVRGVQIPAPAFAGTSVSFPAAGGHYEGTINAAGDVISGTIRGSGGETALVFRRTAAAPNVPTIFGVADPDGRAGRFAGHIEADGTPIDATLHLHRTADGYVATLDVPQQNALGIPASAVELDGDMLAVTFPFGSFVGTFSADRTYLPGTWTQGGRDFPFNLTRSPAGD